MAEVDIVQAESDVANQELTQQEVMNRRDRDRLALLNLLDLNSRIPLIPTETDDVRAITPDYEECLAVARLNRPDYLRAGHDLSAAEIQLDLAKNNRLWDLSLLADYRYSETDRDSSDSDEDEWSAGLRLSIPLYGDLTREQAVIAAQTAVRQAQLQVERLENELAIEVLDAVRDVSSRWARVRLASRARELAGRKLEIEQEKLRRGRSSNFEVVTFQNELTTAQNDEITSRIEYLNALTALDQVLGTTLDTWAIELRE
jgi:outer membrane protein TolC